MPSVWLSGGFVRFVFFPELEEDYVTANLVLADGAPEALAVNIVKQMSSALDEVNEDIKAEAG